MSAELDRLRDFDWDAPQADRGGVRSVGRGHVSYPESGMDFMTGDGGRVAFWFDHRADAIAQALTRQRIGSIWDVGAGAGSMVGRLDARGFDVVAVEPIRRGAEAIAQAGGAVLCGTLQDAALPSDSIEAIGMFDVIEHLDDPTEVLVEAFRVLRPGGSLVITVPALPMLWCEEDELAGHRRRYRRSGLRSELAPLGFVDVDMRYLFASLIVPIGLLRTVPYRLGRRRGREKVWDDFSKQMDEPTFVDWCGDRLFALEAAVSRRIRLPAGVSLLGVFTKPLDGTASLTAKLEAGVGRL